MNDARFIQAAFASFDNFTDAFTKYWESLGKLPHDASADIGAYHHANERLNDFAQFITPRLDNLAMAFVTTTRGEWHGQLYDELFPFWVFDPKRAAEYGGQLNRRHHQLHKLRQLVANAGSDDDAPPLPAADLERVQKPNGKKTRSSNPRKKGDFRCLLAARLDANHKNSDGSLRLTPISVLDLCKDICGRSHVYNFLQEKFGGVKAYRRICRDDKELGKKLWRLTGSNGQKGRQLREPESIVDPLSESK